MRRVLVGLLLLAVLPVAADAANRPARLKPYEVKALAGRDTRVSDVLLGHPLALWSARFDPLNRIWIASLREPAKPILAVATVRDIDGTVLDARKTPGSTPGIARLKTPQAERIAGSSPKARDWVARYTSHGRKIISQTSYDPNGTWTRHWWSAGAEIARVMVNDRTGKITAAWTGPQVAWSMARGNSGAFGRDINKLYVFGPLLGLFLVGLFDWRRLWSWRNLDLIALASFAVSLWFFNRGLVFWSAPLAYPPLVYLFVRLVAIGCGRAQRAVHVSRWPVWLVAGLAIFAMGFRIGLDVWSSNVIDVGYAGVAGADRILRGQSPYGNMPKATSSPCGVKYADGSYAAYKQSNGRCESNVAQGDTYGPVTYEAYLPFTAALGWSGRWDDLPAAHGTAVLFDALAAAGLALAAFRIGGRRFAATALFFWATYPFTAYAMMSNSNDAIVAAFVAWTFALFTWPVARGLMLGLAGWAKFSPILLLGLLVRADRRPRTEPLEWIYDAAGPPLLGRPSFAARVWDLIRPGPNGLRVLLGFAIATVIAFGIYLPLDGWSVHTFWQRTFGFQLNRDSPFSIWDWGMYPGFPDLAGVKRVLWLALVAFGALLYVLPRRLDVTRAAAFAGALLVGFHIVLTHWFYLYIPWFVPCVALALLAPKVAFGRVPAVAADRVHRSHGAVIGAPAAASAGD
jgi:hypothetical protein